MAICDDSFVLQISIGEKRRTCLLAYSFALLTIIDKSLQLVVAHLHADT
jgi:hypothetical protein